MKKEIIKRINKDTDIYFIDYGEIEEILVAYKIGKINLEEAKRIIKWLVK